MSIHAIFFDLDGTLLPMEQESFVKAYFKGLAKKAAPQGYDPEKLMKTIWAGTDAMVRNTGPKTNEAVFWDFFAGVYGESARADEAMFADFYRQEFQQIQAVCGFQPQAAELIRWLNDRSIRVVLATNPIFPSIATESRIRWAGLQPGNFEFITTYDNSSCCKPSPDYYREILGKLKLAPEECLMVGNDVEEDMVARELGMEVFLLTDCLISRKDTDLAQYPHGDFAAMVNYVKEVFCQ